MKKELLISCCLIFSITYAQRIPVTINRTPKLTFGYDAAGNQTTRTYSFYSPIWDEPSDPLNWRPEGDTTKELAKVEDTDYLKFFPEDVISYYPNPVKEELFIKWELINDNKVSSIDVFNLNGQVLKTIQGNLSQNSLVISFQEYPIGVYFLGLNYTNGDQKSIKIVKN